MCVCVALVIQHEKRMRRIVLSSMTSSTVSYFSTLYHKRHDSRQNVTEQRVCFDFLYNFCLAPSHPENNSEIVIVQNLHVSIRYSCRILIKSEFSSTDFRGKTLKTLNTIKIRLVGVELFHAGGKTDMPIPFS